jgi:hypothetical protein
MPERKGDAPNGGFGRLAEIERELAQKKGDVGQPSKAPPVRQGAPDSDRKR